MIGHMHRSQCTPRVVVVAGARVGGGLEVHTFKLTKKIKCTSLLVVGE